MKKKRNIFNGLFVVVLVAVSVFAIGARMDQYGTDTAPVDTDILNTMKNPDQTSRETKRISLQGLPFLLFEAAAAFGIGDTTPNVTGGHVFKTANTSTTLLSDFDDGTDHTSIKDGYTIYVLIADDYTKIDCSSSEITGHGDIDWEPTTGNWAIFVYDSTYTGNGQWRMIPGYLTALKVLQFEEDVPIVDDADATSKVYIEANHLPTSTTGRISPLETVAIPIVDPDGNAAIQDPMTVFHFPAETFPNGFKVLDILISTDQTCTDTVVLEEWTNNGTAWSYGSDIESITLSGTRTEDDGTLSDPDIAADAYIRVDWQTTPSDIDQMTIVFTGYRK